MLCGTDSLVVWDDDMVSETIASAIFRAQQIQTIPSLYIHMQKKEANNTYIKLYIAMAKLDSRKIYFYDNKSTYFIYFHVYDPHKTYRNSSK